jgi:hypothetical protein
MSSLDPLEEQRRGKMRCAIFTSFDETNILFPSERVSFLNLTHDRLQIQRYALTQIMSS